MQVSINFVTFFLIISYLGLKIGLWGIFKKAGAAPYKALIPFYCEWIWIKILNKPLWWMIFVVFPFISVFMVLLMIWKTIRRFQKTSYLYLIPGTLFFFIALPWLGFSKKENFFTSGEISKFKKSAVREWSDALIFAIAAAFIFRTFIFEFYKIPTSSMESSLMVGDYLAVDKFSYGGRVPETILAIPFVHNTIPGTTSVKSYLEWLKFPYYRFPAIKKIERNNVVVFNYPDGDSVAIERQSESYYAIVREFEAILNPNASDYEMQRVFRRYPHEFIMSLKRKYQEQYYDGKGKDIVDKEYKVVSRPVDKRENYVKRCIALPGDTLQIINSEVFINGEKETIKKNLQISYFVAGGDIPKSKRKALNINDEDHYDIGNNLKMYNLTLEQAEKIKKMGRIIEPNIEKEGVFDYSVFPYDPRYKWNKDNFGKLVIPAKGATVEINDSTLCLYKTIITHYEGNTLSVINGKVCINGKETDKYTFKQNYYFMMGDNRHNSLDSRFWGFVPEDHIVGKASLVWLSVDKFKNWGENKIRWNKMFKWIN